MKHHLFCCIVVLVVLLGLCSEEALCERSESIVISSAPSPVGSGARATGIGSAFIAVADDATAASWNPAGLIQLEKPEISAVGSFYLQRDDINSVAEDSVIDISADVNSTSSADLNFLSVAYPFGFLNRNWVASFNYQRQLDFNRNLDFAVEQIVGQGPVRTEAEVEMRQEGGLAALSPALAAQIVPTLSLGIAVNFWLDELFRGYAWKRQTKVVSWLEGGGTSGTKSLVEERDTYENFHGINATLGILWEAYRGLSLGAFFEFGFSADVDRHIVFESPSEEGPGIEEYSEKISVDLPPSFGIGLSYRFGDAFMVTADYTRVFWEYFVFETENGSKYDVQGVPLDQSDIHPTNTFRVGAEYLWILNRMVVPFRVGTFYDPQPAQGGSQDYFGSSVGSGLIFGHFSLDAAYQIRIGLNDKESSLLNIVGTGAYEDVPVDTYQHLFLLSTVYRF